MAKLNIRQRAGVIFMILLLLAPLVYAFIKNPGLISDWLLIPANLTPRTILDNFIALPKALIYAAPHNPEYWLSRLPLLDLFTGTMLLLGLYAYRYYIHLKRTPLIWMCMVLATLIVGLAGINAAIILLPFLYIVIANGISFLLGRWFEVFPKNPVARGLGTALVIVAVAVACFYQLSRYFTAWPEAPATRELYSLEQ